MTKIKRWRLILAATLAAFFAVTLCFALQIGRSARAAEDGVLDGNTAEYTFENDAAYPWSWDKETNTWSRHNSGEIAEMRTPAKLTLKITSDGNVAFKYLIHSNHETDYLKVSKNGEDLNTTQYTAAEYTEVTIEGLKAQETLTFQLYIASSGGGFDYYVSIQGLDNSSFINSTFAVKAEVGEGGGGTVAVESGAYGSEASKDVLFGESTVLKAKADEGKAFFGWQKNGTYVSTNEELAVDVKSVMADQTYTAVFVEPNYNQETVSGWTGTREKYTANVAKAATNTLTIEFVGEQYITFDFKFNFVKKSGLTFEITIDGTTAYEVKSATTITTQMEYSEVLHVAGSGRHVAVFSLTIGTYTTPPSGASASLENLVFKKSVPMQDLTLDWDERLGDVWVVEGFSATTEYDFKTSGHQVTAKSLNLPVGMTVSFYAFPKTDIQSTVISDNTHAVFAGYYEDKTSTLAETQSYTQKVGTGVLAEGKSLEIRFLEYVPLPQILLTKTVGSDQERDIDVKNGGIIEVPQGGKNSFVFQIGKYNTTAVETITANCETTEVKIDEDSGDSFGVVLTNITERGKLSIQLDYGEKYFSDPIEIQLNIATPNGVQDIVFEGANVKVENFEGYYPWFYDAKMSTEEITYTSGISYGAAPIGRFQDPIDGVWKEPFTYLTFTVTGSGSFSFDFYLDGGLYSGSPTSWAGYSLTEPAWGYGDWTEKFQLAYGNNSVGTEGADHVDAGIAGDSDNGTATVTRIRQGENWFSCSIPISSEGETTIYIIHQSKNSSGKTFYPLNQMSVRNVKFFSGTKKVEWGVKDGSGETATPNGTVTATVGGVQKNSGDDIPAGTLVNFKAEPSDGMQFYAWVDGDGKVLSYDMEFTYPLAGEDVKIYAVIDAKDAFAARIGGRLYRELDEAATAAQAGDMIIVLQDSTVTASFTIENGVSLILPINKEGDYYELGNSTNATNALSWAGGAYAVPLVTLTVGDNVKITVKGSLIVGGVLHYPDQSAQGHTSGKYTQLVLNGSIEVTEGGLMDVYGRVTGKGGITVKSGGVLYQPFLILDYAGGQNTQDLFNANQTPFKRYAMINIQCEKGYTIEYGAELYGHASLYFLSSVTTLDTQFISYVGSVQVNGAEKKGTTTLINLKEGASATGVYKDEKIVTSGGGNTANIGHTTLTISGGASAGYMDFLGLVQTNGVAFSIPYNYSLILQDGEYDMGYDYKLMPGASLTVEEDATLTLNAKFYVYDGLLQTKMSGKAYPTAAELKANNNYPTNANFTVNGTLNINEGATFLGVVQTTNTEKTAKIVTADGATLSGKIVDGGETAYDCNYSEYESSARVWDKVHGTLATLTAGHTYVSTYVENDTFGIDAIEVKYEARNFGNSTAMEGHGSHEENANYTTGNLEAVTGLKGAWMVEHEHTYDWTPKEDEKSESIFKGGNSAEIERGCLELGCDEIEKKVLLKSLNTFNSKTYRGTEFTGAELFEELYSGRRAADVGATFTVKDDRLAKDVGTYTITVALEKGFFLAADGTFEASHDFTFVIDRKNVTVSVQDQSSTYTGKEPDVKQGSYTISGLCGDDVLGIVIEKEPGTAAGEYRLTAKANSGANANGNYNIKFSYMGSGHSTYTVNKATLTVKPNNVSSPAGEEPITDFTSTISGFVNGEKGTLEAEIAEQLVYTCTVTKDSPSGRQYAITVKFTGELQNYEVKCESGSYTVTESLFKDVMFKDLVVTYDGTEHSLSVTGTEGLTGAKVEYAPANSYKNAGTYTVTATVTARDSAGKTYTQTFEATLTIERRTVTVELLAQNRVYDGTPASAQSRAGTDWKLADGSALGAGDELSALGVALTVTAPTKNVGTYAIAAVASVNDQQNGNYTVNFSNNNGNLYTITKRDLHITVTEKTTVYGESIDLDQTAWTYDNDTDFIAGDLIHVTLSSDVKKDAGNYHITASADAALDDNKNYNFLFTDAAWTVSPKEITVVITPVSVTYSGQEPAAPTLWELKAGSELVTGDEKSALNIRLTKAAGVNAGSYDINAAYDNGNYTVTFEGGKGGYTVNKYDIGGAGDFFLMAGDEASTSGTFTLRYAGQTIELVGYVIFGEIVDLKVVLSQSSITEIGEYDVTASVDDVNYSGSRTFRVIVVNGNGYTKHLVDTLAQLAALTDGMTAATLTAEDFGALKQAAALIAGLDESERETGKDALAPYESLIAAWNDAAADLDAKIETAESIQNALLGGIFGAAATLGLLLAAAYVVGKGGIL